MRRTMSLLTVGVAAIALATAARGDVIWDDDFDGYPVGPIDGVGAWMANEALVTDKRARSAPNSLVLQPNGDALQAFDDVEGGRLEITAWHYVPVDAEGHTYFILLNTFEEELWNWSTQLAFDATRNEVVSDFDGATAPLVRGAWVEVRVAVDLDRDRQKVYYDGQLLVEKSWREGVSGGGVARLAALDLYNYDQDAGIFWDDLIIVGSEPCPADIDFDGVVELDDVLEVLANWGACSRCPADLDGNGHVGFEDLLAVLNAWGPCG